MNRKEFLATVSGGALAAGALAPSLSAAAVTTAAPSPMSTPLTDLVSLADVEALAEKLMLPAVYDYVAGGAADEITIRWNAEKYREIRLEPRALIDVSEVDCGTTLFGQRLAFPILLAPASN